MTLKITGPEHTDALFLRGIPHGLKTEFKGECVKLGMPMVEAVARFMILVLDNESVAKMVTEMDWQPREFNKPDPPTTEENRD